MIKNPRKYGIWLSAAFLASCASPPAKTQQSTHSNKSLQSKTSSKKPKLANATTTGTTGPSGVSGSANSSTAEAHELQEISELYGKADYDGAFKKLDAFLSDHPKSNLLPQAENLLGLCFLLTKRPELAIPHFKIAIQSNSKGQSFKQYVLYNQAKAEFEAGRFEEATQTTAKIDPQVYDVENQLKFHHLKALLLEKKNLPSETAREILVASRLLEGSHAHESREGLQQVLDSALQNLGGSAPLLELYKEFESSPLADTLLFRLSQREQIEGKLPQSEIHLQTLLTRFPQSSYAQQSQALSRAQEPEAPAEANTIGILLPLKGKFAKFGARSLQGIELAFRIFEPNTKDSKVTLVLEDSGDEPEQTVRALNRLVTKHHVVAVIGPLLTKGIDLVTRRAQELHVPMLTLARQAGSSGDYVIPAGLTLQLQAYEAARYAIQKMNLHRFAILAPRDRVGDDFTQFFWDSVEQLGGEITGVESYNPGETDFRQQVDKLSGLYYTEARQKELDELAHLREQNQVKKRTRKTEQFFNLKPIVDYDAVFVPDEPKIAGQILPTFAYRDVEKIKFIGPSAWNSPELITRAQAAADQTLFVDAYFPEGQAPAVRKFIDRYKEVFNQEPSEMDALAYDAGKLLEHALVEAGGSATRAAILEKLKGIRKYPGVTGTISFKDGQYFRDLKVLTVRNGQIVEATASDQ